MTIIVGQFLVLFGLQHNRVGEMICAEVDVSTANGSRGHLPTSSF
uniref:Uncharacterized protein n=1 Tax=Rhizophora mucronata TaxID=61149 RepID=A0A2P2KBF3_RHIMU